MISLILVIILILVAIIVLLTVYNISINKKIENFNNLNNKVNGLNVLQDFINAIGESTPAKEKIDKINKILLERYQVKYSTIVIFDGSKFKVKASNVDEKHWNALSKLQNNEIFKESIQTAIPKYVTVENEVERLPYQELEFGRAKSAMFFPLYVDNVYIGYWIIEGSKPHEFDNYDTTILDVVKNNIISVLKTVATQGIIENIVRDDKYSELKTSEHLYGEGRQTIDKYARSTVCLYKITNLEDINNEISRKTGDEIIKRVSSIIREHLSEEYIFVRYMGPKFVIVYSGIETSAVETFMEEVKNKVEALEIEAIDVDEEIVTPNLNVVLSTYYKGTALEGLLSAMEEYIDNSTVNEINSI